MFYVHNGRRHYFDSLADATKFAESCLKKTGIVPRVFQLPAAATSKREGAK